MPTRLRVLALDANGFTRKAVTTDTVLQGAFHLNYARIPPRLRALRFIRTLKQRYDALGYISDWRDALCASPSLDVDVCNTTDLLDVRRRMRRIREYDAIVVLHSAAGDDLSLLQRTVRALSRRRGPLVAFIGNEYDLMDEKIGFLVETGANYVCSQLPIETARWLYGECETAEVLSMPHALNPVVYHPPRDGHRSLDIAFAGAFYSPAIGDIERTTLIERVEAESSGFGLSCEVKRATMPRKQWADFLRSARGTVGAESGTYYLDRRALIIGQARDYLASHPGANFDQLSAACFAHPDVEHVSGKCISSRHFEAIGTGTCQILIEGHYNGILEPEVHYIAVRKDLSDLGDAITRFTDDRYRESIVDRAREHALAEHTYGRRVEALVRALGA